MADQDLFAEAMGKVQPLPPADKVVANRMKPGNVAESVLARRVSATTLIGPAKTSSVQPTDNPWVFVADGISKERLKRLAAGRPAIERTFDLHGMSRDEALAMLEQGFGQAISKQVRVICMIHGRGLHSQGKAVLKQAAHHWLREGAFAHAVLAVIPKPGSGGGACLVLLRRMTMSDPG